MELNFLIFPAPESSYSYESLQGELIFIPRGDYSISSSSPMPPTFKKKTKVKLPHIPCLFLPYNRGSSKILIYFHGNAEDIGLAYELLDYIRNSMSVHVLAVEYPGYGIYTESTNAGLISEDAFTIYDYLISVIGWREQDIILFGRSIGTGPAAEVAAARNPSSLILMSAYTSLRAIVRRMVGGWAQYLVKDRFKNILFMPYIRCPTFIIHGLRDTLIPHTESQLLHDACKCPSSIYIAKDMDHNEFDFNFDLTNPAYFFLIQNQIFSAPTEVDKATVEFPGTLYLYPPDFPKVRKGGVMRKIVRKFF